MPAADTAPDEIDALRAALAEERLARRQAEARASSAEAMVAHLKLLIARLKHDRFGASSERGRKLLDQMELQLEELRAAASEDAAAVGGDATEGAKRGGFARRKPARAPLPAHLPRERVVIPVPTECPCCGGRLAKLGEDVTETLKKVSERDIIQERTQAGLAAARARGRQGGRPKFPSTARKVALAKKLYEDRATPVQDICRDLNISRATLYRYLRRK
jgi:Transposase C of IS166 homeodomain/Helix-turn-helix domain of resolvase